MNQKFVAVFKCKFVASSYKLGVSFSTKSSEQYRTITKLRNFGWPKFNQFCLGPNLIDIWPTFSRRRTGHVFTSCLGWFFLLFFHCCALFTLLRYIRYKTILITPSIMCLTESKTSQNILRSFLTKRWPKTYWHDRSITKSVSSFSVTEVLVTDWHHWHKWVTSMLVWSGLEFITRFVTTETTGNNVAIRNRVRLPNFMQYIDSLRNTQADFNICLVAA